ncbi:methanol dehydrogenase regulatory protein [Salinarchaeum sp. Harcht-Bsk1]|uniref:AAA family ATPase n=1 Tax=Salinarchaeum sp. Harcht-Bsk1 TaxID=1333523 RepID=UPI0003422982|nr:MoxR family ATPase [Salinarchaeum sp. Harcht-Bsk1]AGN01115.1 methanol dehydrogenase regulatory protein [Salinarchaeum sp. Harcht-Bsk1]
MDVSAASDRSSAVVDEVLEAVIADREFVETVLTGVLARGHVLLEDVPGTGKTLTANSLATALGLEFSRIQFTPDLLPADVTGTHVFNEADRSFEFTEGPIFANVVLADEINRAPPKTQAALLEAMEEEQVTVDGDTHQLPDPFFVIATQNPVEQEGTFELPEAQVDRFLVKTTLGYPEEAGELELLRRRAGRSDRAPTVGSVLDADAVRELREVPEGVHVEPDVLEYIAAVGRATRIRPQVQTGVSPRGTQRLFEAARAHAVIDGRDFVTPDDVRRVALPVLSHRLVLTPEAAVEGVDTDEIVEDVLDSVPVPTVEPTV